MIAQHQGVLANLGKEPVFRNGSRPGSEFTRELSALENDHLEDEPDFGSKTSISGELFGKEEIFSERQMRSEDQLIENKIQDPAIKRSDEAQLQKKGKEKLLTTRSKEVGRKRTERIVIFYSDRTFGEFIPE